MASNVEIKARVSQDQYELVRAAALARSSSPAQILWQRDTFYRVSMGRLKLREFKDGAAQLIAYERPDRAGPKQSNYVLCPCPDPEALREALGRSIGVRGVVEKRRELIHLGQTRIHLDDVVGLGLFLELEVVLREGQPPEQGAAIARELLEALGLSTESLVEGAYIDLLEARLPA
jgi:predicted adenylyl cyclase CyaB